jgi:hypothetical protein
MKFIAITTGIAIEAMLLGLVAYVLAPDWMFDRRHR